MSLSWLDVVSTIIIMINTINTSKSINTSTIHDFAEFVELVVFTELI